MTRLAEMLEDESDHSGRHFDSGAWATPWMGVVRPQIGHFKHAPVKK